MNIEIKKDIYEEIKILLNSARNSITSTINSTIAYDGVKMPLRRTKSATPSCQ